MPQHLRTLVVELRREGRAAREDRAGGRGVERSVPVIRLVRPAEEDLARRGWARDDVRRLAGPPIPEGHREELGHTGRVRYNGLPADGVHVRVLYAYQRAGACSYEREKCDQVLRSV